MSGGGLDRRPTGPPRPAPSELLIARLRAEHPELALPEGTHLRRLYPLAADRRAGAWTWHLAGPDGLTLDIGGQWPVGHLIRCRHPLSVDRDLLGQVHVDPGHLDEYRAPLGRRRETPSA